MAKKKDLQGAITRGADLFFSANDEKRRYPYSARSTRGTKRA